ncbi:hypothetical protein [Streptomyces sp. NPDC001139]
MTLSTTAQLSRYDSWVYVCLAAPSPDVRVSRKPRNRYVTGSKTK